MTGCKIKVPVQWLVSHREGDDAEINDDGENQDSDSMSSGRDKSNSYKNTQEQHSLEVTQVFIATQNTEKWCKWSFNEYR